MPIWQSKAMWQCKWLNLVDNFGTHASGATWWPNFKLMQVVPSDEPIVNWCKWRPLVAKFVTEASIPTGIPDICRFFSTYALFKFFIEFWNFSTFLHKFFIEFWNFSTWQIFSPPTCRWCRWQIWGMLLSYFSDDLLPWEQHDLCLF